MIHDDHDHDHDLDRMWRDGLNTAAGTFGNAAGVRTRVAARVRHRRHRRRAASAGAVAALTATAVVAGAELRSGRTPVHVATTDTTDTTAPEAVPTVVQVNDAPGGTLRIDFPGHDLGNPASITLPSGVVRFVIHDGGAGHELRIDGIPDFEANFDVAGATITKDVTLTPGRAYVMYCAIPGHREAGESVIIVAR
jgi:uncharacterized cupredoxin-like copper-binding protein